MIHQNKMNSAVRVKVYSVSRKLFSAYNMQSDKTWLSIKIRAKSKSSTYADLLNMNFEIHHPFITNRYTTTRACMVNRGKEDEEDRKTLWYANKKRQFP